MSRKFLTDPPPPPHPRPYWHVDAKWICGLLFAVALTSTLVLTALWRLTSEAIAIPVATQVVASLFSPAGLDDPSDIETLKAQAASQPGDIIHPLPGQSASLTKQELTSLSPRELRLKIFRQVVEPYYVEGVDTVAAKAPTPAEQAKIKRDATLLTPLNRQTHTYLGGFITGAVIITMLLLAGLVFFSWRWGRLANAGLIGLLVSGPPTLFLLAVSSSASRDGGPVRQLTPELTHQVASSLLVPYAWVAATSLTLLLAALIGRLIQAGRARHLNEPS